MGNLKNKNLNNVKGGENEKKKEGNPRSSKMKSWSCGIKQR